ncbi:hypothetical protein DER45DRAFT_371012 [Fusarium avenaceum]|nr:hypothetical protein DER45DRAFT_371012 [Fusarium avenaceum]
MYGVSLGMGFPSRIITISCTPWIPFFVLLLDVTDTLGWLPYVYVLLFYLSSWRIHTETTAWRLAQPKPIGQAIYVHVYLLLTIYQNLYIISSMHSVPPLVHHILLAMSSAVDAWSLTTPSINIRQSMPSALRAVSRMASMHGLTRVNDVAIGCLQSTLDVHFSHSPLRTNKRLCKMSSKFQLQMQLVST